MKNVKTVRSFLTHMVECEGQYFKVWEASNDTRWWVERIHANGESADEGTEMAETLMEALDRVRGWVAA